MHVQVTVIRGLVAQEPVVCGLVDQGAAFRGAVIEGTVLFVLIGVLVRGTGTVVRYSILTGTGKVMRGIVVQGTFVRGTVSTGTGPVTFKEQNQGCGSGLIYYGSGSSIFAQSGSRTGSGSKLKQNFRRQFLSQIFLKSKFESNQIKNIGVIHLNFFKKYRS
jgi:hypothetical protein